jgi:hypothetical protein
MSSSFLGSALRLVGNPLGLGPGVYASEPKRTLSIRLRAAGIGCNVLEVRIRELQGLVRLGRHVWRLSSCL